MMRTLTISVALLFLLGTAAAVAQQHQSNPDEQYWNSLSSSQKASMMIWSMELFIEAYVVGGSQVNDPSSLTRQMSTGVMTPMFDSYVQAAFATDPSYNLGQALFSACLTTLTGAGVLVPTTHRK